MRLFSDSTLDNLRQQVNADGSKSADWLALLTRVDHWCANPASLPTQSGGWIHNYICPTHWMPLTYDGDSPNGHHCPKGHSCEGSAYDEAWLAWRHRQFADMSRNIALAYAITGKPQYLAEVERILLHYTDFYANFVGDASAESWMITARVFNQALTEALWAISLLHAYDFVAADLQPAVRNRIEQEFLRPLSETMSQAQDELISKDNVKSNYMAWFNVTLGCTGFLLNDSDLIARAIDGEGGFIKHLDVGVLGDGMQYEVTPYYHNFVLLAYLILAEAAATNGRDLYAVTGSKGQTMQSMWRATTQLLLPDGMIADLADGSYWVDSVYDRELIEVYEMASARDTFFSNCSATLAHAYARSPLGRDNWAALLFGAESVPQTDMVMQTEVLNDAGVAKLAVSPKLTAVIPFGAHRGSHSHTDQLSLQVWPFSNDAGCVLYGIPARREWYMDGYAHNGIVVDGVSPKTFSQATFNETEQGISVQATDAFPMTVERIVQVDNGTINDTVNISGAESHTVDWVFHVDGDLRLNNQSTLSISKSLGESTGAKQVTVDKGVNGVKSADFTITHNNTTYTLSLTTTEPFDLLLGTAPGTSWEPTQRRHVIIGRTVGKQQSYRMTIAHD